ncbi:MAG: heme lyase CcmF/NrfE family subunit [Candidatus Midichloriaceae bacterium]
MFAEVGNFFLHLSLIMLLLIIFNSIFPKYRRLKISIFLWGAIAASTIISFMSLIACYVISDYSVLNVLYNSHKLKPLIYKIAGSWSNHEGSMLLWIISISLPTFLFGVYTNNNLPTKNLTLILQAILAFMFVLYTIYTSNPFERILPAPVRGLGMNPLLQDIGVSFHPPILYLGYVGFSLPFSASLSVLILKNTDYWIESIKPWIIFAWSFLTIGIGTGAWWAYRELGWGGFWFWDPVENASLIPWITSTALIHSMKFSKKSTSQLSWTILLSILTFTLVMIGTFIVRSGTIASVHSFAQDSKRGFFILISVFLISGSALLLYAFNFKKLYTDKAAKKSTNGYLLLNNIILCIITFIISLGTLYPLLMEIIFQKYFSINSDYYNLLVPPITLILAALCTFGVGNTPQKHPIKDNLYFILISLIFTSTISYYLDIKKTYSILGIFIAIPLILSSIKILIESRDLNKLPVSFSHGGFALLIFSISMFYGLKDEVVRTLKLEETLTFKNLHIKLENIDYRTKSNYLTKTAIILINNEMRVYPEIRFFPIEKQQTVEIDTINHVFYDVYFSINSPESSEKMTVNIQYNPMINFIWLSCALISLAGLISIIQRVVNCKNK